MSPAARRVLPAGGHFAVTWGIPDGFGGMTQAMLARSAAFAERGTPVDVLTFDPRADYPRLEAELRERGQLADGVALVNLYEWLRENPLPGGSLRGGASGFSPLEGGAEGPSDPEPAGPVRQRDGHVLSRVRRGSEGVTLQTDHYRLDGSLLLSDRRDVLHRGVPGGRSIVLCDASGEPVRSWSRVTALYTAWLDHLTGGQRSYLIVDSKTVARLLLDYHRPGTTIVHLVHNSHLENGDDPLGPLRESRRDVFERLDAFDAVAVLTERQRREVVEAHGEHATLRVIPNALTSEPPARRASDRDRDRIVVLAALSGRKRVDHAIRAVAERYHRGHCSLHLDVFGEGEKRPGLEKLIAKLEVRDRVVLHGYRSDARAEFTAASAMLLTSTSEGFPLVLLEAMSAGCLPIAYDVRYGASDIIEDGVNGFLVPAGDEAALVAALERLESLSDERLAEMRDAARATVERFSPDAVTELWAREFRRAARLNRRRFARARSLGALIARSRDRLLMIQQGVRRTRRDVRRWRQRRRDTRV